jgi:hypothetical protein
MQCSFSSSIRAALIGFVIFSFSIPVCGDGTNGSKSISDSVQSSDEEQRSEVISFAWRPQKGPEAAYRMEDPQDRHKIIIFPGVEKQASPSVLIGFHGHPSRGKNPRDYQFGKRVEDLVQKMIRKGEIRPVILVLPVFRFVGQDWPEFDIVEFKEKVTSILSEKKISVEDFYLFGHSGAAGCGGEGLNQAHRISPKAVGFFDTCLGKGWQKEIEALKVANIETVNLHSVETAGFRPKQTPEYQSTFDFGRAYGPLGIRPIVCPKTLPSAPLRDQPYRCAASTVGKVEAFVVNTGEGEDAHTALLSEALRYFLLRFTRR